MELNLVPSVSPQALSRQKPKTFRITGSKKQSEERAALFAACVHAIIRAYILGGLKNRNFFRHIAFSPQIPNCAPSVSARVA
jgi:hypothetical protein